MNTSTLSVKHTYLAVCLCVSLTSPRAPRTHGLRSLNNRHIRMLLNEKVQHTRHVSTHTVACGPSDRLANPQRAAWLCPETPKNQNTWCELLMRPLKAFCLGTYQVQFKTNRKGHTKLIKRRRGHMHTGRSFSKARAPGPGWVLGTHSVLD